MVDRTPPEEQMTTSPSTEATASVVVASSEGSNRYFEGLQVSEHFVTNGLRKTGSEPKPMTHTPKVAKPKE